MRYGTILALAIVLLMTSSISAFAQTTGPFYSQGNNSNQFFNTPGNSFFNPQIPSFSFPSFPAPQFEPVQNSGFQNPNFYPGAPSFNAFAGAQAQFNPNMFVSQFAQSTTGSAGKLHIKEFYPKGRSIVFICDMDGSGFNPTRFSWDFGDGQKLVDVQNKDVMHNYEANGNYQVSCAASDGTNTKTDTLNVAAFDSQQLGQVGSQTNSPFISQFGENSNLDINGYFPQENGFSFNCDLSQGDFHPIQYTWNFGDGTNYYDTKSNNVYHTYKKGGDFTTACTATDGIRTRVARMKVTVDTLDRAANPYALYAGAGALGGYGGFGGYPGIGGYGGGYGAPYGASPYGAYAGLPGAVPVSGAPVGGVTTTATVPYTTGGVTTFGGYGGVSGGYGGLGGFPGAGAYGGFYPYSYLGIPYSKEQSGIQQQGYRTSSSPGFFPYYNGVSGGYNYVPYTTNVQYSNLNNQFRNLNGGFYEFGDQQKSTSTVGDTFNQVTNVKQSQNTGTGFLDCPGLAIDLGGSVGGSSGGVCRVFITAPPVGGQEQNYNIEFTQASGVNAPVVATGTFPVLGGGLNPMLGAMSGLGWSVLGSSPTPTGNAIQWQTQGTLPNVIGQVQHVMSAGGLSQTGQTSSMTVANQSPTTGTSTASNGQTVTVSIQNFAFMPQNLEITAGTTVTWVNNDEVEHTVSATDRSFDSGMLFSGESYSHTFSVPGTYSYICSIHPQMRGTITVT